MSEKNKQEDGFLLFEGDLTFTKVATSPISSNSETSIKSTEELKTKAEAEKNLKEELKKKLEEEIKKLPGFQQSPVPKPMIEQMINLIMQMGSSQLFLSQGLIDDRKLAVLSETDQVALGHMDYRAKVDGQRYFQFLVDWMLTTSGSVGGLRARQLIQLVAASGGGQKTEFAKRPGWFARQTYKRGWEEESENRGQVIVE